MSKTKKTAHPHLRLLPPGDPANVDRYPHEDDQAMHDRKWLELIEWLESLGLNPHTTKLIRLVKGNAAACAEPPLLQPPDPNFRYPTVEE